MNKETLVDSIREWIEIDERIKKIQSETRTLRQKKNDLTASLIANMKDKNIDIFETNNGNLIHTAKKVKSSISKKHLMACFEKLFKGEEEREKVLNYIMESRETRVVENIKRK